MMTLNLRCCSSRAAFSLFAYCIAPTSASFRRPLAVSAFVGLSSCSSTRAVNTGVTTRTQGDKTAVVEVGLTGRTQSSTRTTGVVKAGTVEEMMGSTNPLLEDWLRNGEPFGLPPFGRILPVHFEPAFEIAMQRHLDELQSIVSSPETTFESVCETFDRSGSLLENIEQVFDNLCSSLNTPELQAVQTKMAPKLAQHDTRIYTFPGLWHKLNSVQLSDSATSEHVRLLERFRLDFVRHGATFDDSQKAEYAKITEQLAELLTQFQQNVMADESTYNLELGKDDLAGCPDDLVAAARQAAVDAGKTDDDVYVMTLSRSLVEPFLTFSPNRKLRKILWTAWTQRGALDSSRNNKAIAVEILRLRRRMGQLHGCPSFAHYQCQDRMAQTPSRVMELLETVWEKAKESANREREALESYVRAHEGPNSEVESVEFWDWRYYAEKVRQERYNFDQAKLKPYLSLRDATTALFDVSYKLFGLEYIERPDIPLYHPDVKLYEVREGEKLVALFIHDNFARPYKSSGAWMSEYRGQHGNFVTGENEMNGIPIISNNNNFAKGQGATLLSMDDASTLFHEMGHGHHGMLSNVTYKRLSGTNVLTDFVELPSQLMEHWLEQPEVLQSFHHHETGESIPLELLDQLKAADNFNNGFETVEYTACALLDMALHLVDDYGEDFDLDKFEREELERLDMPKGIAMRHRPTHFSHLFASNHYAAGYYVYLWAEVLDADAFDAFIESGNIFDPDTAKRARQYIYSSGNSQAPDELFRLFRGRDPKIEPMLQKKGLMTITP